MARTDIERLERRRDAARDELATVGDLRPGALVEITRKCGKPTCHCARPGHRGWALSRNVGGKRVNRGIHGRALDETRAQLAEHERFKDLSRQLVEASEELCQARLKAGRDAGRDAKKKGAPRDADGDVRGASLSPGVVRMTGLAAGRASFAETGALPRDLAGLNVDAKQAERTAEALGREIAGRRTRQRGGASRAARRPCAWAWTAPACRRAGRNWPDAPASTPWPPCRPALRRSQQPLRPRLESPPQPRRLESNKFVVHPLAPDRRAIALPRRCPCDVPWSLCSRPLRTCGRHCEALCPPAANAAHPTRC
ncbi:MAG: hypothetical protein OXH52_04575 [Gammaproteobacteria bacterium]|nr:hypothetical protein [Gammaproteobacteria bacterium]